MCVLVLHTLTDIDKKTSPFEGEGIPQKEMSKYLGNKVMDQRSNTFGNLLIQKDLQ